MSRRYIARPANSESAKKTSTPTPSTMYGRNRRIKQEAHRHGGGLAVVPHRNRWITKASGDDHLVHGKCRCKRYRARDIDRAFELRTARARLAGDHGGERGRRADER